MELGTVKEVTIDVPSASGNGLAAAIVAAIKANRPIDVPDGQMANYRQAARSEGIYAESAMRVPDWLAALLKPFFDKGETAITFNGTKTGAQLAPSRKGTAYSRLAFTADLTTVLTGGKVLKAAALASEDFDGIPTGGPVKISVVLGTVNGEESQVFQLVA